MTQLTLDVPGVIKAFGGRALLYRKLCLAKIQISHRTLDNWVYHGIIPMHRFLQLVALAKEEGFKLKLNDYIKNERHKGTNDTGAGKGDRVAAVHAAVLQTPDPAQGS